MGFMKQDINFNLIFLIVIIIVSTILLTLFYTYSLGSANVEIGEVSEEFEDTLTNLTQTAAELELCLGQKQNITAELNESKKLEEKAREEYNKIYEQTEGELTESQQELKTAKDSLQETTAELNAANAEASKKAAELQEAVKEANKWESKYNSEAGKLDNLWNTVQNCKLLQDLACFLALTKP